MLHRDNQNIVSIGGASGCVTRTVTGICSTLSSFAIDNRCRPCPLNTGSPLRSILTIISACGLYGLFNSFCDLYPCVSIDAYSLSIEFSFLSNSFLVFCPNEGYPDSIRER